MNNEKFYDKYWQGSDAPPIQDPLTQKRLEIFLREIKNFPDAKNILDLGCGDGRSSKVLQDAGLNVIGIDISQTAIKKAKENFKDIEFQVGSPEEGLPFKSESFDVIYCAEVIEHIYDVEAAIQEMARVLRKEGLLFLSTPYHGFLKNLLIALFGFEKHFNPTGSHIRFFTKKSLKKLLASNNFEIIKTIHLGRFWPFWMDMVAIAKRIEIS